VNEVDVPAPPGELLDGLVHVSPCTLYDERPVATENVVQLEGFEHAVTARGGEVSNAHHLLPKLPVRSWWQSGHCQQGA
jgi:hypothetical protein